MYHANSQLRIGGRFGARPPLKPPGVEAMLLPTLDCLDPDNQHLDMYADEFAVDETAVDETAVDETARDETQGEVVVSVQVQVLIPGPVSFRVKLRSGPARPIDLD